MNCVVPELRSRKKMNSHLKKLLLAVSNIHTLLKYSLSLISLTRPLPCRTNTFGAIKKQSMSQYRLCHQSPTPSSCLLFAATSSPLLVYSLHSNIIVLVNRYVDISVSSENSVAARTIIDTKNKLAAFAYAL